MKFFCWGDFLKVSCCLQVIEISGHSGSQNSVLSLTMFLNQGLDYFFILASRYLGSVCRQHPRCIKSVSLVFILKTNMPFNITFPLWGLSFLFRVVTDWFRLRSTSLMWACRVRPLKTAWSPSQQEFTQWFFLVLQSKMQHATVLCVIAALQGFRTWRLTVAVKLNLSLWCFNKCPVQYVTICDVCF